MENEVNKIKEELNKLRLFIHSLKEIFIIIDAKSGKILECNKSALELYGYDLEEFKNKTIYDLSLKDDIAFLRVQFACSFQKDIFIEIVQLDKNKDKLYVEIRINGSIIENKKYIFLTVRNLKDSQKVLRYITDYEYNRELNLQEKNIFTEHMNKEAARCKRNGKKFSILIVKLEYDNGFIRKEEECRVFMKIEEIINETIRKEDMAGKFSDNIFGIIQTRVENSNDALILGNRIIKKFDMLFKDNIKIGDTKFTLNIGISIYNEDAFNSEEMLKNAFSVLNRMNLKSAGRCAVYTSYVSENALEDLCEKNNFLRTVISSKPKDYKHYGGYK